MARVPYSSASENLMYVVMCTRPNIIMSLGWLAGYRRILAFAHWKVVKRVLRYLKGTTDYMLCYQASYLLLIGYSELTRAVT